MKHFFTLLLSSIALHTAAQGIGDYNSAGSGSWESASTWLRFDGMSFTPASSAPTAADGQVVILPGHTVTVSTSVSIDEVFVAVGGTLITSGGTFTVQNGPGNDMSVNGTWQWNGANVDGPGTIVIANSGTLTWTNGNLGANGTITVQSGCIATFNATGNVASNMGIINNAGIWNMEGGVMGQTDDTQTGPKTFNNLPGGVVNLIGWSDNSTSWRQVVNNQGTINKNNGTNQFTFSNTFGGNTFTNLPGGVVDLGLGNMAFSLPAPVQSGSFNIGTGTTLFINSLGYDGPGIVNNGTIAIGTFTFQGTAPQTLDGNGSFAHLAIDNAAGVDLGGTQTVTNTLTLSNGQLRLHDHDLIVQSTTAAAVSGGGSTSWIRTDGTGSFSRSAVNGQNYRFPVGTGSYTPLLLILMNAPQETFSVRVQDGVSTEYGSSGAAVGSTIASDVVGKTWILEEQNPGGHTVNMAVDWNAGDELSLFNRSACRVNYYDGTDWVPGATASASGTGPYTRSFIGLTNFRELCVSDTDADLNGLSTGVAEEASGTLRAYPNPADDRLFIDLPGGSEALGLVLFDANGREVMRQTSNLGGLRSIPVRELPSGLYTLMLVEADGKAHQQRIAIER